MAQHLVFGGPWAINYFYIYKKLLKEEKEKEEGRGRGKDRFGERGGKGENVTETVWSLQKPNVFTIWFFTRKSLTSDIYY